MAPDAARLSFARWLLGSTERWPQRTYLTVTGLDGRGRLVAPRDERFTLEVRSDLPGLQSRGGRWIVPGRGEPLALRRKPASPAHADGRWPCGSGRPTGRPATGSWSRRAPRSSGTSSRRRPRRRPSTWSGATTGSGRSGSSASTGPRWPRSSSGSRSVGAASAGFRDVDDPRQHLVFLPDTEVELTLVGNEAIADARLTVHPGSAPKPARVDRRTFVVRWTLREATTLEILLTSGETGLLSKPAFLSLGLLKDREPRVDACGRWASAATSRRSRPSRSPSPRPTTSGWRRSGCRPIGRRTRRRSPSRRPSAQTVPIPLSAEPGRPVLDHQVQHDVILQSDPPKIGTILQFLGEAEDRCARGAQTGRSGVLQMQVVSPDELFYEILIRQRAERAKFVAILEAAEKQTPVLAGSPSSDDFLRVMRVQHSGSRQLDQIAGRIADTLQEMKLNQIGSPKSHRLLQEGVIDPIRALNAGPVTELRGVLQSLAGAGSKAGANREAARTLHEDVVTKMKNILEQMSQWESFVDVVNQVAEVIKMQQKVLQATEKARESRTQEIFDEKP